MGKVERLKLGTLFKKETRTADLVEKCLKIISEKLPSDKPLLKSSLCPRNLPERGTVFYQVVRPLQTTSLNHRIDREYLHTLAEGKNDKL